MGKIFLIRHAECQGNVEGRLSGITDFSLTQNGIQQAYRLAKALKEKVFIQYVFSSPLKRAVDTANIVACAYNLDSFEIDDELREINYGSYDGMTWADINARNPTVWANWKEIFHYPVGIPKQEKYIDVQKRMVNAMKRIAKESFKRNICVISHGLAIQSFLCYIKRLELSDICTLKLQDNTAITVLDYCIDMETFEVLEEAIVDHLCSCEGDCFEII